MRHVLLALALWGCGGPPVKAPTAAKPPAVDPLTAELARRASAPRGAQAVVTFAIFHPDAPATPSAMVATVRAAFADPPQSLVTMAPRVGARPELSLIALPIDAELPLDVEALKATAGDLKGAADAAKSVRFVRYVGPPNAEGQHLLAAAMAAFALADGSPIVDLSTRRWLGAEAFAQAVSDPDWVHEQVVPAAEPSGPETLRFFTVGMAKLGLPDVELDGVPKAEARARFDAFQKFTFALRAHGYAEVGDVVDGVKLVPCVRPENHYDHKCVRVPNTDG